MNLSGTVNLVLIAALIIFGAPLVWRTIRGMWHGKFAADLVAALAIIAAIILGQPIPGLVVVLMLTGGEALERYAEGRASRAVRELEAAAPRIAHLVADDIRDVPVDSVEAGDLLLIRPGEVVPCDGIVVAGRSHLDTSSLTGEPLPVLAESGLAVQSGSINQEGALTIEVTAPAAESQYARIVELVRSAQASKAPIQRAADRAAVWFTPAILVICAGAWLASGDPNRILAVLVVATPCPLILATPVAIVGGVNRAARRGIVMRNGGALESLARVDTVVLDKTGTLTVGRPEVVAVHTMPAIGRTELLRLTGAVESRSGHLMAQTLAELARSEVGELPEVTEIIESPGRGVAGLVDGKPVMVGSASYIGDAHPGAVEQLEALDSGEGLRAWIAIDGAGAGIVSYADHLRPGVQQTLAAMRGHGIHQIVLLSGDSQVNTDAVAREVGIADAHGDLLPEDKVSEVTALEATGRRVLMVGDGTNDAPALSTASVGVALAAHGGGISAEAADVVLLRDDIGLVVQALGIGRRTMKIARQSIGVGLGLSLVAVGFAAAGFIAPIVGALLQEAIDVAVILNALRASVEFS